MIRCQGIVLRSVLGVSIATILSCAHTTAVVRDEARTPATAPAEKAALLRVRPHADRLSGVVQLTGKDLVVNQKEFKKRTPADPVAFVDPTTGEVHIYGTQVDGTGFSYLKYQNQDDLLRGAQGELISSPVYLPNGTLMKGDEAIWDTYRLSYSVLEQAFPKAVLEKSYSTRHIPVGSDLYYGGIALQKDNKLGRWLGDNWRRRVHVIAPVEGRLQILPDPVFNKIPASMTEKSYKGFGLLKNAKGEYVLPGDYIGHAYGPNFKLIERNGHKELWVISEEVTRRVMEENIPVEVTEIRARRMKNPFEVTPGFVTLVTVNGKDGRPHKDSDRGAKMAHTKLIEGFRPTSIQPEGIFIDKQWDSKKNEYVEIPQQNRKEYFFLTGSPGNFAGDDYDVILAYREGSAINFDRATQNDQYHIITEKNGSWKRYLTAIKQTYHLSWAGRGSFMQDANKEWWLLFHAVDKDMKPDGSYSGVIPENTPEYHRNIYAVPVEFYLNEDGQPDMALRR